MDRLLDHYQRGRFVEAEKLAATLTGDFPNHPFSWKVLQRQYWDRREDTRAVVANPKAVELSRGCGSALQLSRCSSRGRTIRASRKKLWTSNFEKRGFAEAYNNLGNTLKELKRLEEAEANYRKAINYKADYVFGHNLGSTLQELGKVSAAEASYKQAVISKADHTRAHNNLGNTLKGLGKLGEAEISYKRAILLEPSDTDAFTNLGLLFEDQGRIEEAEAVYDLMIKSKSEPVSSAKPPIIALLPFGRSGSLFSFSVGWASRNNHVTGVLF